MAIRFSTFFNRIGSDYECVLTRYLHNFKTNLTILSLFATRHSRRRHKIVDILNSYAALGRLSESFVIRYGIGQNQV